MPSLSSMTTLRSHRDVAASLLEPGPRVVVIVGLSMIFAPLNVAAREDPQTSRFVPLAVNMRLQAPGGPAIQVTTVRIVPKLAE